MAHNEKGWGELSDVNTVTILAAGIPSKGPNITSSVINLNSANLTWTAITSPENGYS